MIKMTAEEYAAYLLSKFGSEEAAIQAIDLAIEWLPIVDVDNLFINTTAVLINNRSYESKVFLSIVKALL